MNIRQNRKNQLLSWVLKRIFDAGIFSKIHQSNSKQITVLNYHRIIDSASDDFSTFKPNVSASPHEFNRQMEYVKNFYEVIALGDLLLWFQGKKPLPSNSLLITFDDGYYDNLEHAYPILNSAGFSAVIFLATNYIGSSSPFFWDFASYCAYHTKKDRMLFPNGEYQSWENSATRDKVVAKWVQVVKYFQSDEKQKLIENLATDLNVSVPLDAFAGLHLNWDQVRKMRDLGIEFGAHTASHPILTKVPLSQVEHELVSSKNQLQEELKKEVFSFAYPNGGRLDISPAVVELVKKTGFKLAFTLLAGPTSRQMIKKDPYQIRRIYVGRSDTLPRFAAKLAGVEKISELFQR